VLGVLPVASRYLPESVAFLVARGGHDEARSLADRYGLAIDDVVPAAVPKPEEADRLAGIRMLFRRTYLPATLLFAEASSAVCCSSTG
jgi:AAHS family benzoate transporter-like MFS transporter